MREGREGVWLVNAGIVIAATGIGIGLSPWFPLIVAFLFVFGVADGTTFVAETNLRQRRAPTRFAAGSRPRSWACST